MPYHALPFDLSVSPFCFFYFYFFAFLFLLLKAAYHCVCMQQLINLSLSCPVAVFTGGCADTAEVAVVTLFGINVPQKDPRKKEALLTPVPEEEEYRSV